MTARAAFPDALPVELACRLSVCPPERRWLIEGLWADQAVGIIGGEPKCCKSFLALDMAVAVASGSTCLRWFPVPRPGPVLLYAAEDALHVVRQRLESISHAAGTCFHDLPIHVITASQVRLDSPEDRARLRATVDSVRPTLLILDPFVRLHRIDENVASEVAPLLAYLRDLQRSLSLAVALVHHARKGSASARAGQALRGSSELHAWGDSNLYLRRVQDRILLSIEHRAAPSETGIPIGLTGPPHALALRALPPVEPPAPRTPADTVKHVLAQAQMPLPLGELRRTCHLRAATLSATLAALVREGHIRKTAAGYEAPPA